MTLLTMYCVHEETLQLPRFCLLHHAPFHTSTPFESSPLSAPVTA